MTDEELCLAAESVYDGWYVDRGRVDWDDFIDRLESYSDEDLGSDMLSPRIRAVKRHISAYRKL